MRIVLGTVGDDYLFGAFSMDSRAGEVQAMLDVAAAMDRRGLSFESALPEPATLFHRIALWQFAPQALADRRRAPPAFAPYAEAFDAGFLQLCYQIAIPRPRRSRLWRLMNLPVSP
ncbi:MAG: hypothetical protein IPP18_15815 [Rhodocyclaceae bacterium]|nr:hypothetical protein [Rhodocyclaceae bacterium]